MNEETLLAHLKENCLGKSRCVGSRTLCEQFGIRDSELRKKVSRLRRKELPIASNREGYFYAKTAGELYSTIRQLLEMRDGLDASIRGLEAAMNRFGELPEGGEGNR